MLNNEPIKSVTKCFNNIAIYNKNIKTSGICLENNLKLFFVVFVSYFVVVKC